ncbi:MAG: transglutaminase-like cysteine peptidase [Proteobacteria bacterium]|nr:transglutaminase-like cysteine peptidase [Pseudomonadota bacterium]
MVSQWTRVLGRVSRRSEAFARCAADETQCTSRGMRYWLQILTAAADLGRKEQLQAINRFFNRWPYRSDREIYRVGEYWATPSEFMARSGDCEDYAIAKFFALRELGFSNDQLRIAIVYDRLRGIGHAVLAVNLDDDILILNNQTDTIASPSRYENFIPWYLVNETALWTAAPGTLDALVSRIVPARPVTGPRV